MLGGLVPTIVFLEPSGVATRKGYISSAAHGAFTRVSPSQNRLDALWLHVA